MYLDITHKYLFSSFLLFLFLLIGTNESSAQNNAIVEIESTSKGILIPRMDSTERKAIPVIASGIGTGDDGLLVYDSTYHAFYFYDGAVGTWIPMIGGGTQGPIGPQGPIGLSKSGAPGPSGPDGTPGAPCWDLNGNGVGDFPAENKNGDGIVDINDCRGAPGIGGPIGSTGPAGVLGTSLNIVPHTTDTNVSTTWYDWLDSAIPPTAKVFVQNADSTMTKTVFVSLDSGGSQWLIGTSDFTTMPDTVKFNIIWKN